MPGFDGWGSVLTLREIHRLKRSTESRLHREATSQRRAFSLIELIVVVGVMLMLMGLAVPACSFIKSGNDFAAGVSMVANSLEQSRAYAMANNTYVFWGIQKCDANTPEEEVPKVSGVGRVAIGAVVSLDGTRIYDPNANDMKGDWEGKTQSGTRFMQLGNILCRDGVSLATNPLPGTGNLLRTSDPRTLRMSRGGRQFCHSAPHREARGPGTLSTNASRLIRRAASRCSVEKGPIGSSSGSCPLAERSRISTRAMSPLSKSMR